MAAAASTFAAGAAVARPGWRYYINSQLLRVVAVKYGVPGARSFARLCGWYAALNGLLCGTVVLPGVQANNLSVRCCRCARGGFASCAGV